ncbi:MAG: right-handed parallel beta-helix repeat-containing protein [bacterium]|nr:right-handed parallel beta-helix repeat-containing protein [bacterium]
MNFKFFTILLCLLFIFTGYSISAVYYVSSTGNDNNNGLSTSAAWKTITKVNSSMSSFNAGDQILFKRGEIFSGTLTITKGGTTGNQIVFGSYGSGNLPEITGKKAVTAWTLHSGNIYKATISDTISHLYIGFKLMTIARFPNTGFLKIDVGNNKVGFYDAALNQSNGYWSGANCRVRTVNWTYESRIVNTFGSGNITFTSPTIYNTGADWGYFFDNKLVLLDAQNEWYHDRSNSLLYFYAPSGVNPNTLTVEAVVKKNVLHSNLSIHNFTIQDLKVTGGRDMGMDFYTSNNITIQRCYINHTGLNGIRINGLNNTIDQNTFEDNLNNSFGGVNTNSIIKNNIFNRTGLVPGYGYTGWGYIALDVNVCSGTVIEFNNIDSSGYTGISVAKSTIVRNNVIDYSCLVLNDGAGIDITDCDTLRILNNIVSNTIGNFETSALAGGSYSCGIYVNGALMKNSTISGNTCYTNRYYGILIDHKNTPVNNVITDNTCYNNFFGQILFTDFSAVNYVPSFNTVVRRNILYSLQAAQNCMEQRVKTSASFSDYGNFDSNYYCNPYSEFVVRRTNSFGTYVTTPYSLSAYQSLSNEDLNSKATLYSFDQYGITDTLSGNLITNFHFNTNVSNWVNWPAGSTIAWINNPLLDAGAMRIRWTPQGGYTQCLVLSNRYPIVKGSSYLVSVSALGDHSGTFNMWGRSSFNSSLQTFPQTFLAYENYRKELSFTFKADTTDPLAYVSVGLISPDSLVYVDNVNIYHVSVDKIDSTAKSKLFVNKNNYAAAFSLNGIPYSDIDGNPVGGNSINIPAYSSKILINADFIPSRHLQLKTFVEGLYNSGLNTMTEDTGRVYLRNLISPYSIVDSGKSLFDINGNSSFNFFNAFNAVNYYIVFKHRSSVETWSKSAWVFTNNELSYDFTTAANKAYGDNLKLQGSKYCVYSGDINNDGQVEVGDLISVYNKTVMIATGYLNEDINGDDIVDVDDLNVAYNNTVSLIGIIRP